MAVVIQAGHPKLKKQNKEITNINVVELKEADMIVPAYIDAMNSERSTILIEHSDLYNSGLVEDIKESKNV